MSRFIALLLLAAGAVNAFVPHTRWVAEAPTRSVIVQNSVDGVNPEIDEDFCDMTDDGKAVFLEVWEHGRSFIDVRYLTRACSALFQCVCRLASAVHGHRRGRDGG